jgi:hypothetical protein
MLLVMPSCDGDGIAGVMSARAYRAGCVEAEPCPNVKRWIIIVAKLNRRRYSSLSFSLLERP